MKRIIPACFLVAVLCACGKQGTQPSLNGTYTENSPVNGRSQLTFTSQYLVKSEPGSTYKDTFSYSITPGKITLRHWSYAVSSAFDFEYIDEKSFRIENLYPSIPGNPKVMMLYKK